MSDSRPREWWITSLDENDDGPAVLIEGPNADRVHVIESSAYEAVRKSGEELARIHSKLEQSHLAVCRDRDEARADYESMEHDFFKMSDHEHDAVCALQTERARSAKLLQRLEKLNHALANAQEWHIADPEDSEMDRDAQIGNWVELALDEIKEARTEYESQESQNSDISAKRVADKDTPTESKEKK